MLDKQSSNYLTVLKDHLSLVGAYYVTESLRKIFKKQDYTMNYRIVKHAIYYVLDHLYAKSMHDDSVLNELSNNGFSVRGNLFSRDYIDNVNSDIDRFDEKYFTYYGNDRRIFGSQHLSRFIRNYFDDPLLRRYACEYLNSKNVLNMSSLFGEIKYDADSKVGSGGGWHRDSYIPQFKTILYLTDVDASNGPFKYVPFSHRWDNIKVCNSLLGPNGQFLTRYSNEQVEKYCLSVGANIQSFSGEKGTVVLADTRGIHTGAALESGNRRAITNYYSPRVLISKGNAICGLDRETARLASPF